MQKLFSAKLVALFAGQPVLHPDALTHCDVRVETKCNICFNFLQCNSFKTLIKNFNRTANKHCEADLKSVLSAHDMHQNKCVCLSNTWVIDYVLESVCIWLSLQGNYWVYFRLTVFVC